MIRMIMHRTRVPYLCSNGLTVTTDRVAGSNPRPDETRQDRDITVN